MKILAIDPATETGWAMGKTAYGLWSLKTRKDESTGMKWLRFKAKIQEVHEMESLDVIVYERPAGRHQGAVIHHAKLAGVIEQFCVENKIEYRAYSAGEIKKFATGKGNSNKEVMIKAAQEKYGYMGSNDNEADALHLWHLASEDLQS